MRIVSEWNDYDSEIKHLWDQVYKNKTMAVEAKDSRSETSGPDRTAEGKISCYRMLYKFLQLSKCVLNVELLIIITVYLCFVCNCDLIEQINTCEGLFWHTNIWRMFQLLKTFINDKTFAVFFTFNHAVSYGLQC